MKTIQFDSKKLVHYESWGCCQEYYNDNEAKFRTICINPKRNMQFEYAEKCGFWYVVRGEGKIKTDSESLDIYPGRTYLIKNKKCEVEANGETMLEIIETQTPSPASPKILRQVKQIVP